MRPKKKSPTYSQNSELHINTFSIRLTTLYFQGMKFSKAKFKNRFKKFLSITKIKNFKLKLKFERLFDLFSKLITLNPHKIIIKFIKYKISKFEFFFRKEHILLQSKNISDDLGLVF